MSRSARIALTFIIIPMLYLSGVRFISQSIVSTDRSSLFRTTLGNILSTPQVFDLNTRELHAPRSTLHAQPLTLNPQLARPRMAGVTLHTLVMLDPFNADYRYLFARELAGENMSYAETAAQQAIRFSMADPKNWLLLGWIKGKKGFIEQGYAAFDRSVMLDPARPDSFAQQGMYLYQIWLTADDEKKPFYRTLAMLSLRTALELDGSLSRNPQVNTSLASFYYSMGQPGYAVGILTRVHDNTVLDWPLALQRMALFFELGEGVKAMSAWKKLFDPKELSIKELDYLESKIGEYTVPEFAYFLAQVHIAQGKYDQALKGLIGLVAKKNETAEYKVALASVYDRMGNHKEASRLYEEALRLSPANQEAKKKVMEYYSKKNRY